MSHSIYLYYCFTAAHVGYHLTAGALAHALHRHRAGSFSFFGSKATQVAGRAGAQLIKPCASVDRRKSTGDDSHSFI
jgi:hypothetical protein